MPQIHIPPSGDARYTHIQSTPATVWPVNHGLGKFPSVASVDSSGSPVDGVVDYVDEDNLTITYSAPFGGAAYCN
jgi:hypothetical protein